MMTKKEKKRVPELRFEGFEEEWESTKLKKIFSRSTKKNSDNISCVLTNSASQGIVSQDSYFDRDIANPNNLEGYYVVELNDFVYNPRISNLAPVGPLKRNRLKKGVMSPLYTVLRPIKGDLNYLESYFESNNWHYYMKSVANYGARFDRMNITISDFENLPVIHPSLSEQQKIATFLTSIDTRIQQLEKKKTLLEQYKKGVMQKIFSQEIRFKRDDGKEFGKWEKRKMSDMLFEHKLKSTGIEEVHSVSVHKGVINQIEHLGRSFAAKYTDHYSRALPHDLIYTKSPTGEFPLGIIKQNHIVEDVILSPLYGVFTPETKELGYILHVYFESPINTSNYLSSIIQKGAKNTINITNDTFLSKKLFLPVSKEEQTKIAHFLSSLDSKIAVTNRQIEKTKEWKKGLLQRMFV